MISAIEMRPLERRSLAQDHVLVSIRRAVVVSKGIARRKVWPPEDEFVAAIIINRVEYRMGISDEEGPTWHQEIVDSGGPRVQARKSHQDSDARVDDVKAIVHHRCRIIDGTLNEPGLKFRRLRQRPCRNDGLK